MKMIRRVEKIIVKEDGVIIMTASYANSTIARARYNYLKNMLIEKLGGNKND